MSKTGYASLRLPEELLAKIDARAEAERRSRSQVMLLLLEFALGLEEQVDCRNMKGAAGDSRIDC